MIAPANRDSHTRIPSLDRSQRAAAVADAAPEVPLPAGSPSVGRRQGRARRTLRWLGVAVLVVGIIAVLGQSWHGGTHETAHASPRGMPTLRTVTIERPTPATAAKVELPASVRPWQTATLHARVSGYLTAWHRDLGERVRAGDLLAEIEAPELDQQLAEAEALTREAIASNVQAQAELVEAEADLKVTEAQLVRVQAEVALAKSQLARRQKLLVNRTVTQEEFETFEREVEARTADVAAAEADVARRKSNLSTRAAVIEAREAFAKSRQSNVERLRELQGFKRIVAPFDGIVTRRSAEVGMLVNEGKEPIYVVEDMRRVRVQVSVPQSYAARTIPGTAATVRVPESEGESVEATVTRIAESVDAGNRTMLAEVELDNTNRRFQPGSFARVVLEPQEHASPWTIPTSALSMRVDGPHVAVVDERGEIELRRVQLGRDLGSRIVVIEGITGIERLVINPTDDMTTGTRVQANVSDEPAESIAQR
ncbi:MAG: efflux RND transporter periplasmic adaptor subunit [Pirellulales bacterium]|nr:efflux RND transporter periplasmic adaptor subunit [Pirellulales bacterium]